VWCDSVIDPEVVVVDTGDGPDIVAFDHGGDGPNLLFLHATGMHGRMWDPVIELLADFRCVAVDARGHGRSDLGDSMEWSSSARDIETVIDRFDLHGSSVVGHSFGGCLAMILEVTNPGLFERAWLYEPIIASADLGNFGGAENPMANAARRRREVFESTDAAFERYMSKPPFASCNPDSIRAYVEHGFEEIEGGVRLRCRAETEARTFEASTTTVFERLGSVATDVVVVGSGDGGPPAVFVDRLVATLPNSTLERWADRTHFGPLEDPARAAQSIRNGLTPAVSA
jgi:pimeloyl-ACP methyl ester carboxylesterase